MNVALIEPEPGTTAPQPPATITPMDMLDRAIASGAGIETLEKLMALQERWEKNQARKAFDEAMAAAKAEIPTIKKNRQVGFDSARGGSRVGYRHEDLGEIAKTIDPVLAKHGLSYRFNTHTDAGAVTVTCIVSHRAGHSESNALSAGNDTSGAKNAIQAIGSTITYLQRYTLKAALGLAASNDDDGRASASDAQLLSDDQVDELSKLLTETKSNFDLFLKKMKVESLTEIRADKFEETKALIKQTAAKRAAITKAEAKS